MDRNWWTFDKYNLNDAHVNIMLLLLPVEASSMTNRAILSHVTPIFKGVVRDVHYCQLQGRKTLQCEAPAELFLWRFGHHAALHPCVLILKRSQSRTYPLLAGGAVATPPLKIARKQMLPTSKKTQTLHQVSSITRASMFSSTDTCLQHRVTTSRLNILN